MIIPLCPLAAAGWWPLSLSSSTFYPTKYYLYFRKSARVLSSSKDSEGRHKSRTRKTCELMLPCAFTEAECHQCLRVCRSRDKKSVGGAAQLRLCLQLAMMNDPRLLLSLLKVFLSLSRGDAASFLSHQTVISYPISDSWLEPREEDPPRRGSDGISPVVLSSPSIVGHSRRFEAST